METKDASPTRNRYNYKVETPHNCVRKVRKLRGLSLEQLAEITGLTFQNISNVERGSVNMRAKNWLRLAQALGVSAEDLANPDYDPEKNLP